MIPAMCMIPAECMIGEKRRGGAGRQGRAARWAGACVRVRSATGTTAPFGTDGARAASARDRWRRRSAPIAAPAPPPVDRPRRSATPARSGLPSRGRVPRPRATRPLDHHREADVPPHLGDQPRDGVGAGILEQARRQRLVDLQDGRRKPLQVAQRGVAGAEVVDRDLDSEAVEHAQGPDRHALLLDQGGLRDLHDDR
jgi:hypothetical protein